MSTQGNGRTPTIGPQLIAPPTASIGMTSGSLVEVLAAHRTQAPSIRATFLPRRRTTPRVRALLQAMDVAFNVRSGRPTGRYSPV